jgi:hypothetical protein
MQWVPGIKLASHCYLESQLRMSGTIPLLPLYDFTAYTGATTHSSFYLLEDHRAVVKTPEWKIKVST